MSGTTPPGAADPSMDDILASIRKILNEDDQPAESVAGPPVTADATAIQLTPDMMIAPPEALVEGPLSAVALAEPEPASMPEPVPVVMPPPAPVVPVAAPLTAAPSLGEGLVDPIAVAAAAASLGALSRAVAQERATQVSRGGPSIEDVVREEVRPLLKAWLDEHLPATVERLVRAEIERVMARQG